MPELGKAYGHITVDVQPSMGMKWYMLSLRIVCDWLEAIAEVDEILRYGRRLTPLEQLRLSQGST